jgi:hypothetical protein
MFDALYYLLLFSKLCLRAKCSWLCSFRHQILVDWELLSYSLYFIVDLHLYVLLQALNAIQLDS